MPRLFLNNSEAGVVRRAQKGDTAAMRSIYDSHVQYLAATCRRYISSQDDSKDVLQEAFIKIFSSLGRFEYMGPGSLKAWMTRIVVNEALLFLRRTRKDVFLDKESDIPDVPDIGDPDPEGIPPGVLAELISRLPPGCRTVLNLFVFEQRSHKEIAQLLGIKENSSTSQYHRAKALLAESINRYKNEHRLEK